MCAAAAAMGVASPFFGSFGPGDAAKSDGLFHARFYVLPTLVDQWIWPEEPIVMRLLAMTVLTVQFLALFAAVAGLMQLAGVMNDFIKPHKHRRSAGSLMRRRL
jgi:hypothetical protein